VLPIGNLNGIIILLRFFLE